MKHNSKKIIGLLLCLAMLFSLMPAAFAEGDEPDQSPAEEMDETVVPSVDENVEEPASLFSSPADLKGTDGEPNAEEQDGEENTDLRSGEDDNTVTVTTAEELAAAVRNTPDNGTEFVIELGNDILISSPLTLNAYVSGEDITGKSVRIRLVGNGYKIYAPENKLVTMSFKDRYAINTLLLGKDDGSDSLTFDGVKLSIDGPAINISGYDRTKRVYCYMYPGVLSDGRDLKMANFIGGGSAPAVVGVSIGDTFIMYGGKITRWQFSAIDDQIIASNSYSGSNNDTILCHRVFEMYGGEICNNRKDYGGTINAHSAAVHLDYCERCIIAGGVIHDNRGSGLRWQNYRVGQPTSEFLMSGGEIYNNSFVGIDLQQASSGSTVFNCKMTGGKIHDNGNAGIRDFSTFEFAGGEIYDNDERGIYNNGYTFKMSGGRIYNNTTTEDGGGVYTKFMTMTGGEICDNHADGRGGGVYLPASPVGSTIYKLNMSGSAKIHNNTATVEGADFYAVKQKGDSYPAAEYTLIPPFDETLLKIDNEVITGYFEDYEGNRWAPDNLTARGGAYTNYKKHVAFIFAHTDDVTVTFDTDGGTPVPEQQVLDAGQTATRPPQNPTKTGYTFNYWTLNGEEYDFSTPVTQDITLVAKWTPKTYKVYFNAMGGSPTPPTQTVPYLGTATEPLTAPTKPGYTFNCWKLDGVNYDFSTPVTKSITLIATWTPIIYHVTYNWGDIAPADVTLPVDTTNYKWHNSVTVDPTYTNTTEIAGELDGVQGVWRFSGWTTTANLIYGIESDVTFTGTWTFSEQYGPVTLTAASDSRPYDGTYLRNSDVNAEGLPAGFTVEATASGGQRSVGWSPNRVDAGYVIRNAAGEDKTGCFPDVALVDGRLEVTKADLRVMTPSAEKTFDGRPFPTGPNGPFNATFEGLAQGETICVVWLADGETEIGTYPNEIRLIFAPEPQRGLAKAAEDEGTADGEAEQEHYMNPAEASAIESNYNLLGITVGELKITEYIPDPTPTPTPTPEPPAPKEITVTGGSSEKTYDGTPLTNEEFAVEGLPEGYTVEVVIEGSQTTAGSSENVIVSVVIKDKDGQDKTADYTINKVPGTLTVKPAPLTVTADSAIKLYDGTPLTKDSWTSTGTVGGDEIVSVTVTGSQTEVGTSDNVPSEIVIKNADGEDVTACYEITLVNGVLKVTDDITEIGDSDTPLYGEETLADDEADETPLYNPYGVPSTGDNSHTILWSAICAACLAAICALAFGRKRRKDD
ncbi:MAG: InlB B-repeat-containing protein [Clostridia bacterium]|nr:InlB B-repeat-containing protein [Clostridia bacterium]